MPIEETKDLKKFLKPYPKEVQEIALWLREFVWKLYPGMNELIYDNYNAVAFGWAPNEKAGDAFCSIAVTKDHCNFGFNRGSEIPDYDKILIGNGNQYRYIKIYAQKDLPKTKIKKLLKYAVANSLARMKKRGEKQMVKGKTIVKSISPVKKRPA